MDDCRIAGRANLNRVYEPAKRGRRLDVLRHAHSKGRHVQRLADVTNGPRLVIVVVPNATDGPKKEHNQSSTGGQSAEIVVTKHGLKASWHKAPRVREL
jgi:hypothetical protein